MYYLEFFFSPLSLRRDNKYKVFTMPGTEKYLINVSCVLLPPQLLLYKIYILFLNLNVTLQIFISSPVADFSRRVLFCVGLYLCTPKSQGPICFLRTHHKISIASDIDGHSNHNNK